jgi:hypothetical protein
MQYSSAPASARGRGTKQTPWKEDTGAEATAAAGGGDGLFVADGEHQL